MAFILQCLASQTFWSAVEALAALATAAIAAIVLFREVPRIRREASAHRVEGLKYTLDLLQRDDFTSALNRILDKSYVAESVDSAELEPDLLVALDRLELVGKLAELGYVDQGLVCFTHGGALSLLGGAIGKLARRDDAGFREFFAYFTTYRRAFALLRYCWIRVKGHLDQASSIWDEFEKEETARQQGGGNPATNQSA